MIILGIDPGSNHTGYGVIAVDGPKERLVACGAIHLNASDDHGARLVQIHEAITALVDAHHPDEGAVEMPIFGHDPQSLLKLGRAQAAAMLAMLQKGVPVTQYTPAEVKKAVTGNGAAAKPRVAAMVAALLGDLPTTSADAADALAVALCHAGFRRHGGAKPAAAPRSKGRASDWDAFLRAHPERLKGNG